MKIESLIRRDGGSLVTIGGVNYHFKPDESGRHIAVVTNPEHLGKLLAIREGYRLVADSDPAPVPPNAKPEDIAAEVLTPGGEQADPDDGDASAGKAEANDAEADMEPEVTPDPEADPEVTTDPDAEQASIADMDRNQLMDAYEKRFGSRPSTRWSSKRIAAELEAEVE